MQFMNLKKNFNKIYLQEKLLSKCGASLKFLKTLQSTTDQDRNSDIVQRKQDREIRCKSFSI